MLSPCQYIALSYCWGRNATAVKKTTEKTLDDHQRGIRDQDLPVLHQEAVALARGLKINYLWIDALCIIQDSTEDKEKEIMQMGNIFAGALVVVVAAAAESPLDSLMRVKPRSDQSHIWRDASPIWYEETNLNVKFRKRLPEAHWYTSATLRTHTGARAWCFQEKQLANRCLVFRDDEVVWECRSCCQCECGGKQEHFSVGHKQAFTMLPYQKRLLPSAKHDPFRFQVDGTLTAFAQLPFAEHEPFQVDGTLKYFANDEAAYSFWDDAVLDYSARALTFEPDRLPAISAVASIVAKSHWRLLLGWTVERRPASWIELESKHRVHGFGSPPRIHSAHLELGLTTWGGMVSYNTLVPDQTCYRS